MAEWGDVAWDQATTEYRMKQFVAICKELVDRGEHENACEALASTDEAIAEAMYDALDDGITAAENAVDESSEDDEDE